jgi:hypothetical protein
MDRRTSTLCTNACVIIDLRGDKAGRVAVANHIVNVQKYCTPGIFTCWNLKNLE